MNLRTNFYGAIGLVSTLGKNGFAAGQTVSEWGRDVCHIISPVIDVKIAGHHVFENLESACENIRKFDKWASNKCQEWEEWSEIKWAEAKKQEELNEEWIATNLGYGYQPPLSKFRQLGEVIKAKKQEIWPEKRYTLPRREKFCSPNYLQRVLGLY